LGSGVEVSPFVAKRTRLPKALNLKRLFLFHSYDINFFLWVMQNGMKLNVARNKQESSALLLLDLML
jgi:hypothetical protein